MKKLTFQQTLALKRAKEGQCKHMDFIRAGVVGPCVDRLVGFGLLRKVTNLETGNIWEITNDGLKALRDGKC